MRKWLTLLISITFALAVGYSASLLTQNSMEVYSELKLPIGAPPAETFSIVWSILYVLMGVSSYLVYRVNNISRKCNLCMYVIQLGINASWTLVFFLFQNYFLAMLVLMALIILVIAMIGGFFESSSLAAYLQFPYLVWLIYALYLNVGIFFLNI